MQLLDISAVEQLATSVSSGVTVEQVFAVIGKFGSFIGTMVVLGITITLVRRIIAKASHGKAGI